MQKTARIPKNSAQKALFGDQNLYDVLLYLLLRYPIVLSKHPLHLIFNEQLKIKDKKIKDSLKLLTMQWTECVGNDDDGQDDE